MGYETLLIFALIHDSQLSCTCIRLSYALVIYLGTPAITAGHHVEIDWKLGLRMPSHGHIYCSSNPSSARHRRAASSKRWWFNSATDTAGGLTLVNCTNYCPLYVGQEPLSTVVSQGLPLTFTPYAAGENIIRESRDVSVAFSAVSNCAQSTAWRIGEEDPETSRRLTVTGGEQSYFRIDNDGGLYELGCPGESCPDCDRPRCGSAGILIENGKRLLALDGSVFPFRFRRA
ncbi:hypothetical protein GH714_014477 [Hevea brasiliensis]|uniref:Uncharacterized protein n=1 Tax=Hevea brasiliensis TaxID=3981 RepID=A0A6A6KNN0_HEVBR|nr:hypothetical protein GH714_014477 [Hevea brasiliensis]